MTACVTLEAEVVFPCVVAEECKSNPNPNPNANLKNKDTAHVGSSTVNKKKKVTRKEKKYGCLSFSQSRKTKNSKHYHDNHNNVKDMCSMASSAITTMALLLLLLFASQSECFHLHFGLSPLINEVRIDDSGSFIEFYGSHEVRLDEETVQLIKSHASGPIQFTVKVPSDQIKLRGGVGASDYVLPDIDSATIRQALKEQYPTMTQPKKEMPVPSFIASS